MKHTLTTWLARVRGTFQGFSAGQKAVAVVGTAALLLAGVMVFRWAATPNYAPLYSNLASSDASAVIDELNSEGVTYKLANSGSTIMVPQDEVYSTRIALSGKGLPGNSGQGGYSILDNAGISTSQFQEQTDFKRAMEGELSKTIEAIDGVQAAVVHLALPPTKVFADQQDPPTASVLVATSPGTTLTPEQVQAIVHLVASSVDGMSPDSVTVADNHGQVLTTSDGSGGISPGAQNQQVVDYQDQLEAQVQSTLDRVLGPGNSTVQVTADLDFDKATTDTTTYNKNASKAPLSSSTSTERYAGPGGAGGTTGVVGPDGQMGPTTTTSGGPSRYTKESTTEDNALGKVVEHRETAPGSLNNLHVGVVLDSATTQAVSPQVVQNLVASAIGVDPKRGDTIAVSSLPFDRTADKAAQAELAQAAADAKQARTIRLLRDAGIALAILAILLLAWVRGRRRERAREAATTYLAEQIRQDTLDRSARAQALETNAAVAALERAEATEADRTREELAALVEKQPEHVAALLRGWLTEQS